MRRVSAARSNESSAIAPARCGRRLAGLAPPATPRGRVRPEGADFGELLRRVLAACDGAGGRSLIPRINVCPKHLPVGDERLLRCHACWWTGTVPARDPPSYRRSEGSCRRLAAPRAADARWRPIERSCIWCAVHGSDSILYRDDADRHRLRQRRIGHLRAGGRGHHRRDFRHDLDAMAGRDLRFSLAGFPPLPCRCSGSAPFSG